MPIFRTFAVTVVVALALAARALAQAPPESALTGIVRDESGGVMQAVIVQAFEPEGEMPLAEATTDADGRFTIPLRPGRYRVEVSAPAFVTFQQIVTVGPGAKPLEVLLALEPVELAVEVTPSEELFADTSMSLTSRILSGDELLDLPADEEELARYLLLLAGGDITGDLEEDVLANFVIDGFEDGRLPRPDQISQIIIDPDSLSADGSGPRIEIVTRPGTGRWRRSVDLGFADESLNARTPGEIRKEPRQTRDVQLEIEGPIVPNVLEVSFEASTRSDERAGNSLRAITPSGELFRGVVQPRTGREFQVGAELQINPSHRLDLQFSTGTERSSNGGVGGFTLPERGSDERGSDWMFRVSERMFRENFTNNVRLQVSHESSREVPVLEGYAINVADAFRGGGGTARGSTDSLAVRLEDNMRLTRGAWNLQWGARAQYDSRRRIDQDNFNGTFEFASLHDYCRAAGYPGPNCAETERIVTEALASGAAPVYIDGRGREVEITGVPVTFTQAFGNPELEFSELGFETHIQADRRIGESASLRIGLQYEATNHSRDFLRLNPTANFQYRVAEGTVISAGSQIRFQDFRDYETLLRNDGATHETELFISLPSFPDPFVGGTVEVGGETASSWVLDPGYRSPYTINPQLSVRQEVPGGVRLTLSWSGDFGRRQRRTRNINAPFPGTPLPDEILDLPREEQQAIVDRMRPLFPHVGNITQIESTGRSSGHSIRLRAQPRGTFELAGIGLSGNIGYTYRRAFDDNDFNNPYQPEWGPSRRDHGVQSQFRISLPDGVGFANPLLRALARATYAGTNLNFRFQANTGSLYSIRSGRDLNGDQSSNDRPPGIARNTEVGPGRWNLDMTFTKDYRLGGVEGGGNARQRDGGGGRGEGGGRGGRGGGFRRGGDGPRIRFQARINNLLNHAQPRAYGSVVTSPLFGLPTGYTGGRTVNLSMNIDF